MKIISHRGNLNGPNPKKENSPKYIKTALKKGYDVEVDVWLIDKKLWLGHDSPIYKTNINFLKNKKLWCHAKNTDAFLFLKKKKIRTFWHENDRFVLTTKHDIWCYKNVFIEKGITVCLDFCKTPSYIRGICTDYPRLYKNAN